MTLKFEIYRNGERLKQFSPVNAMAVGPESMPWSGSVGFRDEHLVVSRNDENASAVALLWDMGARGAYQLETTRLPPRAKAYVLNVELARFRLMKIVQKQEDWNLFDFPRTEKFQQQFREAQGLFAEALAHLDRPSAASKLADRSLGVALDLSEDLARFHAELLLVRRKANGALPKHLFGCRVDWTIKNQKYRDTICEMCDFVVLPMPWKLLQPTEDAFVTDALDEWVEALAKKRMLVIAGPLVDLSDGQVPEWLYIWEHDFETLRDLAYDYVRKVVSRYRRAVTAWNVVAGLHATTAFTLSFEQMIELTRVLVQQVRTIASSARTIITVKHPFGEYHASSHPTVPPMLYAEMVAQAGMHFDAFALEWEMGVPTRSQFTRDMFQLSSMLDRFSTLGKPVFLTSLGVPDRATPDSTDQSGGALDPATAGRWHEAWSPQQQAKWLDEFARIALSKPYIENLCWANFADLSPSLPGGGLLNDMLQPKPSMAAVVALRESLGKGPKKSA
ncbi:MAG: endo-1,4-beta-xylanase [Burkholderiales bacterium]|nr:endo-1,4-beta-xylanase [Phycisphaerae bacterium]